MESSSIGLNNLPDEILMIIFQKLNNIDVLYSFHGVNHRLNKIIHDQIFTNHLTFVKWSSDNFIDLFSLDKMLNRFCLQILPSIHDKIQWLDLDSSTIKHVLCVANYPNLDSLGLYNIDQESAQYLFTDETLSNIFKNQITTLFITIYYNNDDCEGMIQSVANICDKIFTIFTRLTTFVLYESSYRNRVRLNFEATFLPNFRSSTLLKLIINVHSFDDCLYILDGRFDQLHTLSVDLVNTWCPEEIINQRNSVYVFGYLLMKHLLMEIIKHMPRLNQFTFFINSYIYTCYEMNLVSTEDIQQTFIDFPNNKIISYVHNFADGKGNQCHIYLYPFLMRYYTSITNSFPGGLFEYVRVVSLFDEHPFEHEFFLRIVQSFPFIEQLSLVNHKPQNQKQSYESNNDNRNLSVIKYFFLNELYIGDVHDNYIEQFLFDSKTYLQNNVILFVDYQSLQRVTHNFTRDAARINCAKISELHLCGQRKHSNSVEKYFPYAKIYYPLLSL